MVLDTLGDPAVKHLDPHTSTTGIQKTPLAAGRFLHFISPLNWHVRRGKVGKWHHLCMVYDAASSCITLWRSCAYLKLHSNQQDGRPGTSFCYLVYFVCRKAQLLPLDWQIKYIYIYKYITHYKYVYMNIYLCVFHSLSLSPSLLLKLLMFYSSWLWCFPGWWKLKGPFVLGQMWCIYSIPDMMYISTSPSLSLCQPLCTTQDMQDNSGKTHKKMYWYKPNTLVIFSMSQHIC